jgi:hypothetical protein
MPTDAEFHVRRRLPGAFCSGRLNADLDQTIFTVMTSRDSIIATGRSVAEAWDNAAVIVSTAPDDEGEHYLRGRDVQQMIGGQR